MLCKNFTHQQLKFDLQTMDAFQWKLLRLRPAHFPSLRIAQLAALLYKMPHLFSQVVEAGDLKSIYLIFDVSPGIYWQDHVGFSKPCRYKNLAAIGKQTKEILIINVVIPFLFAYGTVQQNLPIANGHWIGCNVLKPRKTILYICGKVLILQWITPVRVRVEFNYTAVIA